MKKNTEVNKKDIAVVALIYIAIIVIWELLYYFLAVKTLTVKEYIFPHPLGVIETVADLTKSGLLFRAVIATLKKMLIGYGLSIIAGALLGALLSASRMFSLAAKPLILGLQTLPSICWVPFAVLWFGLNESATIFVIIIGSSFSMATAVETAIKGVNPLYIKAARTMGAGRTDLYFKVILPAGVPQFISGLKQGWSFAWRALMAGEMMSSTMGLGFILQNGRELLNINQVMTVILIIIAISVLIERLIFNRAEKAARRRVGATD